jgi:hypothetical protein
MPVEGDYEPSTRAWVREQVEQYESSGGTQGTTLRGAQRQAAQDAADAG